MTTGLEDEDTSPGGRTRIVRGPTGNRLAVNVQTVRQRRGLTIRALSARLAEVGRPILPSGLVRIESGARAVDVDDLVALASVLGCTPNTLLLDPAADDTAVPITGGRILTARHAWEWARGNVHVDETGRIGWHLDPEQTPDQQRADLAEQRRTWARECRPDEPDVDPAQLLDALDEHRELLDALAAADLAAGGAGIPERIRSEHLARQRTRRHVAERGPGRQTA